jgi:hypothetical protein
VSIVVNFLIWKSRISYTLMLLAKGSLPPVTIPKALTDAGGGLTINYDALALIPDFNILKESLPVPF